MTNLEDTDEERKASQAPQLRLVTDTGGLLPPSGDNWLMNLPTGSCFFCKDKGNSNYLAIPFEILSKMHKVVQLIAPDNSTFWVDSKCWSKEKEFLELVKD